MELLDFKELGIALTAIIIFAFLIKYIIDKNKQVFDALIDQLSRNRTDYSAFVESNNHQNADRIEKSTEAMVTIAKAIEQHTRVVEKLVEKMEK